MIFIILVTAIITRLTALWVEVLNVDEAIWAVAARAWLNGGIPYIDFADNKPLGIMATMAATFKLTGVYSLIPVHILTIIIVAATGVAIMKLVERFQDRRSGFMAAILYVVFSTNYIPKIISTNIETIINLPLVMSIFFLMRRRLFWSGTMIGIACCFKYQAGILALYIPAALIFLPGDGLRPRLKTIFLGILAFTLGAVWPFAIMLLYLHHTGSIPNFIDATLSGSVTYIAKGSEGLEIGKRVLVRLGTFLAASSPLWYLAIRKVLSLKRRSETFTAEILIMGWLLITSIPVFMGWRLYGNYFLLWLPPLSALAGVELALLWNSRTTKIIIVTAITIITIGFSIPRYFTNGINHMVHEDNPEDYRPIALKVKELTSKDDKIFAWGFAPCIYYFSDRLPAYRYLWSDRLTGRYSRPGNVEGIDLSDPAIVKEWNDWQTDMDKNKPAYIIDTAPAKLHDAEHYPANNYPALKKLLGMNYILKDNIAGADLYKRK